MLQTFGSARLFTKRFAHTKHFVCVRDVECKLWPKPRYYMGWAVWLCLRTALAALAALAPATTAARLVLRLLGHLFFPLQAAFLVL